MLYFFFPIFFFFEFGFIAYVIGVGFLINWRGKLKKNIEMCNNNFRVKSFEKWKSNGQHIPFIIVSYIHIDALKSIDLGECGFYLDAIIKI